MGRKGKGKGRGGEGGGGKGRGNAPNFVSRFWGSIEAPAQAQHVGKLEAQNTRFKSRPAHKERASVSGCNFVVRGLNTLVLGAALCDDWIRLMALKLSG